MLKIPSLDDLVDYPPMGGAILPLVKPSGYGGCASGQPTVGATIGCASGWTYLDGSPVPDTVSGFGGVPAGQGFWQTGYPIVNQVIAAIFPTTTQEVRTFSTQEGIGGFFTAYYSCCSSEDTCLAFAAPSGKGKSNGRRLY